MVYVHLHLAMNHIPVIGLMFTIGIFCYALLLKSDDVKKLSLGLFALLGLATIPVFVTGEKAHGIVTKFPGVLHRFIESHENAAILAMVFILAAGLLALYGLFLGFAGKEIPAWHSAAVLIAAIMAMLLVGRAANLGGQIRHPEIRPGGIDLPTEKDVIKYDDEKTHNH